MALTRDIDTEGEQERTATSETEGILQQCRKRNTELASLQEASESLETRAAQRRREADQLEKNLTDDSGLLKELLDHLSEAEKDNLLLLQYSAEDASKIKVEKTTTEKNKFKHCTCLPYTSLSNGYTSLFFKTSSLNFSKLFRS